MTVAAAMDSEDRQQESSLDSHTQPEHRFDSEGQASSRSVRSTPK